MKYYSTKNIQEKVSFKEAVLKGLAPQKGLYMPTHIPALETSFFEEMASLSNAEIAHQVLLPFVEEDINSSELQTIVSEAFNFEAPLVEVKESVYALELFHGPTKAFKDFGARFMSRCLGAFRDPNQKVKILVATSGDTGGAVANGFWKVPGVGVIILFPKGGVSQYQEEQMTTLGENITAIEVEGSFDDCQTLVKEAFSDEDLNAKVVLSSANSINIGRLLPQMVYYFLAYKQLKNKGKEIVVSVPSGNFGNLTAGLIAKKMGLPIHRFVAATNVNDTFVKFYESGNYQPKPSVATLSNAMDVGAPSNFDRLFKLYDEDLENIKKDIASFRYTDEETLAEISKVYAETQYVLDPHGAVALMGLEIELQPGQTGVFLETAHPLKFKETVVRAIPELVLDTPESSQKSSKKSLANDYDALRALLLKR